jgi:hypothetical protein
VDWAGNLTANNAYLEEAYLDNVYASGEIAANIGVIGGWYIDGQKLRGGTTTFKNGGDYSWSPASPEIYLDAPDAAICGGKLKPTASGNRMKLCGSLEICDSNGNSVTSGTNHIGYVSSGMPDA